MPIPTKEPMLLDREPETAAPAALARFEEAVSSFERLLKDPTVDPDKLEKFIAMRERMLAHEAKAQFEADFAEMQGDLPTIDERGRIIVGNETRSTYGKLEDIVTAVRPILKRYGFALRFRNVTEGNKHKTIGILSHRSGHSEQDEFETPPDRSGSKADIQAIGSARSYGQRYTTISLLNIVTRGVDDDGRAAGRMDRPQGSAPDGYEDWITDMSAAAGDGWTKLSKAFSASKAEYRNWATRQDKDRWESIKARAQAVRS